MPGRSCALGLSSAADVLPLPLAFSRRCSARAPVFSIPPSPAGLIYWKPTTPGLRHKITIDYEALGVYTGPPTAALSRQVAKTGGRNDTGRITTRHRGGGPPKVLREVTLDRRPLDGVAGVVQRVELDPNRSGFLALVKYSPGR
jgi:ribosomal protein L2